MSDDYYIQPTSALQALLQTARRHYAVGNDVQLVSYVRSGADSDLGAGGTVTTQTRPIEPEPCIGAVRTEAVLKSGGAVKYSDLLMSVVKDALKESEIEVKKTQFLVNNLAYELIAYAALPSTWELVIRRRGPAGVSGT